MASWPCSLFGGLWLAAARGAASAAAAAARQWQPLQRHKWRQQTVQRANQVHLPVSCRCVLARPAALLPVAVPRALVPVCSARKSPGQVSPWPQFAVCCPARAPAQLLAGAAVHLSLLLAAAHGVQAARMTAARPLLAQQSSRSLWLDQTLSCSWQSGRGERQTSGRHSQRHRRRLL